MYKNIPKRKQGRRILTGVAILGCSLFGLSSIQRLWVDTGSAGRLLSINQMYDDGASCYRPSEDGIQSAASSDQNLFSAFQPTVYAQDANTQEVTRPPIRNLWDTDPVFSSVGVDPVRNEVFLQDSNKWTIRVYGRTDNAKPGEGAMEPRRMIGGPKSDVQFNSCVWVDPGSGNIYTVENDTGDSIVVFDNKATGDPDPIRKLKVTHRAQSMVIDDATGELFLSVQYPPQVVVYSKTAKGDDKPMRIIEGDNTRLSDVHGLGVDGKNKRLFVASWGAVSDFRKPGSGRFELPSIEIYPTTANGDVAPAHVIQGPKTQLDWPGAMSVDADTGDLYVANDMGNSILVFHGTDQGDVAPYRVIRGAKTHLSYPAGVFVDSKNKEVWASNLGNATATVYPLNASGDVEPLRTIRGADENKQSLRLGKTEAIAYDPIREQILVPN
jgi:6-phosphogluconolactonase (cycloisomerase 2 family)